MSAFIDSQGGLTPVDCAGETVLDALKEHGVEVTSGCGGIGTCGNCWVRVTYAGSSRWQLACQTVLEDGMTVSLE